MAYYYVIPFDLRCTVNAIRFVTREDAEKYALSETKRTRTQHHVAVVVAVTVFSDPTLRRVET